MEIEMMCKVRKFQIKKGKYGGNTLVDIGKMRVLTGGNKCETEWNKNSGDRYSWGDREGKTEGGGIRQVYKVYR